MGAGGRRAHTRETIRLALGAENIESRPVWKPMHRQPIFQDCETRFIGNARGANVSAPHSLILGESVDTISPPKLGVGGAVGSFTTDIPNEPETIGGSVAESLFQNGLCLPSGSNLTDTDLGRVTSLIRSLRTA